LTGAAATITFSAIPQFARHLMIVTSLRTDRASASDFAYMQVNGIVGAVYDQQLLVVSAAVSTASEVLGATSFYHAPINGNTATAGYWASGISWLLDYSDTGKSPTVISKAGRWVGNAAGNGADFEAYQKCRTLGAVTSIVLFPAIGPNFLTGSVATLYGIG
jgi:hypothetical protein